MSVYKIYRYIDPSELPNALDVHPGSIAFDNGRELIKRLPKKPIIHMGERIKSIYFDHYDSEKNKYIDPIVEVEYRFDRDDEGLIESKTKEIVWYFENGEKSPETKKHIIPITEEATKLREIKRRRDNILDELKGLAKKFSTSELDLSKRIPGIFEKYQLEKGAYVDAGSDIFLKAVMSDDSDWLDKKIIVTGNTSREVLGAYLSVGLAKNEADK